MRNVECQGSESTYVAQARILEGSSRTLYGVWVTGFVHRTHIRCGLHLPRIFGRQTRLPGIVPTLKPPGGRSL